MTVWTRCLAFAVAISAGLGTLPAFAGANLIVNGDFSQETVNGASSTQSAQVNGYNGYSTGATLTGWSNSSYTFVFTPGAGTSGTTADTTGATINQYGGYGSNPNVYLWGPGAGGGGVQNGLINSPDGGSFVGIDGAVSGNGNGNGVIYQQVGNLTAGQSYQLSFYWATAQQGGFTGTTDASVTAGVSDGSNIIASYTTPTITLPSEGFYPWQKASLTFVADAATQYIGFLASGSPAGNPPFALLDGVSLSAVPEPASWGMMVIALTGLAGVTAYRRNRRSGRASTSV